MISKGKKSGDKVKAILAAPKPNNFTQVKSFTRMVNNLSKFLPELASLMNPWYELLKKDSKFVWFVECARAFHRIKKFIVSDGVLVHFDSEKPLIVTCDASQVGVVAALSHEMPER